MKQWITRTVIIMYQGVFVHAFCEETSVPNIAVKPRREKETEIV